MIDYIATIEEHEIVLRVNSVQGDFDLWRSEDGWLEIVACRGGSSGWLGAGGCSMMIDPSYLPIVIKSPSYEYEEDRAHTLAQLTKHLEEFNGHVLP
jgi:hypothetical protein